MFEFTKEGSHEKVSACLQNKCSLVLPIFRIWPFSANAYCPKLLAIFFPDWQFSSQIGNFFWIRNLLSLLFSGVMIWILIKTGHGYLFRIPRKKWLWYSILTVLVVVLQISFNVQTAKHVQSTAEGWAVLIGYSGTNFAELGIYITLFFLTPLMEELIYRGLLQHAFFKHSRFGLDLLLPSILFALPHFSSLPSLLDIFIFATSGIIFASLTRYTKSIYPSYAVHVINNIFATLPFLLTFLQRVFR